MTAPVRVKSGLAALFAGVKAYFEAKRGADVSVVFGYRQRAQQLNQGLPAANRVIFLPADPNGSAGKLGATPVDVGRQELYDTSDPPVHVADIRPLASWERQFTLSIWGYDETNALDELLQMNAAEDLFEQVLRAVESFPGSGGMNLAWGGISATVPKENTLGAELLVSVAFKHPLMDEPEDIAFPGFVLTRAGADTEPP